MEVEPATADDVEAIRAIARESWEHDYPGILSSESLQAGVEDWYSPQRVRDAVTWARADLLVARLDGTVVGFAHAVHDFDRAEGNLLRLYVHPDHRGDGYGTALLEAVRDAQVDRGASHLRAMVLAENDPGNAFYERFGFERVETNDVTIGGETYTENTLQLELDGE
jgi:ribosomal protein S18 acetylase RimI-like enzyme